jgi:poly(A) polymerase
LEQETFAAVVRHAKEVSQISGERILIEIQKTLTEERASWGVQKWVESELLAAILPEIQRNWVASGKLTLAILDAMPKKPWLSKLAAMLWCSQHARSEVSHSSRGNLELESAGCAAPIACDTDDTLATLKSRLKLSNYELDALRLAVQLQVKLCNAQLEPWSRIQPALVLPHITYALNVFEARAAVCGGGLTATSSWLARQLELPTEQLNPPALVDGGDLIALGFAPGPEFAGLLREVRARQLDGQLQDRTTAAEWLVQRLDEG